MSIGDSLYFTCIIYTVLFIYKLPKRTLHFICLPEEKSLSLWPQINPNVGIDKISPKQSARGTPLPLSRSNTCGDIKV
jgi:hypothetical protein